MSVTAFPFSLVQAYCRNQRRLAAPRFCGSFRSRREGGAARAPAEARAPTGDDERGLMRLSDRQISEHLGPAINVAVNT